MISQPMLLSLAAIFLIIMVLLVLKCLLLWKTISPSSSVPKKTDLELGWTMKLVKKELEELEDQPPSYAEVCCQQKPANNSWADFLMTIFLHKQNLSKDNFAQENVF